MGQNHQAARRPLLRMSSIIPLEVNRRGPLATVRRTLDLLSRTLPIWGLALVILLAPPGVAQQEADPQEPAAVQTAPARIHRDPHAVVDAFVSGMRRFHEFESGNQADLDLALSAFEADAQLVAREELEILALQLFESLKRMTHVGSQELTGDDSVEDAFVWEFWPRELEWQVWARAQRESERVDIPFLRIAGGGEGERENWRFAPAVIDEIPSWYERFKDFPLVEAYARELEEKAQTLSLTERWRHELKQNMPAALRQKGFLLENWQWVALAIIAVLGVVIGRLMGFVMRRLSLRLGKSERLEIDKEVLTGFERPFSLWLMAWVMFGMLPILGLEQSYFKILRLVVAVFLSFSGVWSAFRLVDVGASILQAKARRTETRFDDVLVPLVRRSAKIFLFVVGIVFVANYISDDLYGIVAGLSIGSLAIGFAAKDSIENLFGTVTVLLDKPYQLGDWITVGDIDGTVEQVGFRSTKIRTFYNSVISVPNSRFISVHIDNWGERRYRRIKTMVSLAYGTSPLDIEAFCEALRELIRKHPYTRKDYYHVYLNKLGASSLDVLVYCFVETPDWSTELREKHRLYLDILRVADGLDVEIAFPTQTLHVQQPEAPSEGIPRAVEGSRDAERQGRELADLIVKEGLANWDGGKPPPVVID